MAVIACFVCFQFTCCSKGVDINGDEENFANEKYLISMERHSESGWGEILRFTYDEDNRVERIQYVDGNPASAESPDYYENFIVVWDENGFTQKSMDYYGEEIDYIMSNERVTQVTTNESDGYSVDYYTYDSSNRFIFRKGLSSHDVNFYNLSSVEWNNNKIVKFRYTENRPISDYHEVKYNDKICKGFLPYIWTEYLASEYDFPLIVHPELVGLRTNQLPSQFIFDDSHVREFSSYTFDADGYVTSFIETDKHKDGDTYVTQYYFTWQ